MPIQEGGSGAGGRKGWCVMLSLQYRFCCCSYGHCNYFITLYNDHEVSSVALLLSLIYIYIYILSLHHSLSVSIYIYIITCTHVHTQKRTPNPKSLKAEGGAQRLDDAFHCGPRDEGGADREKLPLVARSESVRVHVGVSENRVP